MISVCSLLAIAYIKGGGDTGRGEGNCIFFPKDGKTVDVVQLRHAVQLLQAVYCTIGGFATLPACLLIVVRTSTYSQPVYVVRIVRSCVERLDLAAG